MKVQESAVEAPRDAMDHTAYRVHFSCENTGRCIRRTKRRIRWVFGFHKQRNETKSNEEHEIELIWSVKSGKTRILWNQCPISSIIREGGDTVEFTWKTKSNDVLKVLAHSSDDRQYDLWINGVRFSQLPTLSELVMRRKSETVKATETKSRRRINSCDSLGSISSFPKEVGVPSSFRLALVGLQQTDSVDDELRSELYSSVLDEVRLSVTNFLPQTEDMISRAIMDVFISEDDTGHSSSSSLYVPRDEECCHFEVNALYETLEWTRSKHQQEEEEEEVVLAFLQKQIMGTIRQIRNEQISSQTAIRILVGVASLLDLPFVRPMVQDTVILEDCCRDGCELREFLSRFGVVEWFSVSKKNPRFACCRFRNEKSVVALLEAVRDKNIPENLSGVSFAALSNSARSRATTEDLASSELGNEVADGPLRKPNLIKSVSEDTASSTCASPQSLCSMYTHQFLLE